MYNVRLTQQDINAYVDKRKLYHRKSELPLNIQNCCNMISDKNQEDYQGDLITYFPPQNNKVTI